VAVYDYFRVLAKNNDLSFTAHADIAHFLAASYTTMLTWLQKKHAEGVGGPELLIYWHRLMERQEGRKDRERFFSEVVTQAKSVSHHCLASRLEIHGLLAGKSAIWTFRLGPEPL
jgi:hypothetical protein